MENTNDPLSSALPNKTLQKVRFKLMDSDGVTCIIPAEIVPTEKIQHQFLVHRSLALHEQSVSWVVSHAETGAAIRFAESKIKVIELAIAAINSAPIEKMEASFALHRKRIEDLGHKFDDKMPLTTIDEMPSAKKEELQNEKLNPDFVCLDYLLAGNSPAQITSMRQRLSSSLQPAESVDADPESEGINPGMS